MSSLSSDTPLKDPSDDLFSVAPFAETLAEGLLKMFQPEGFVVALHGPWGSGKTTLLNFVRDYLDKHNTSEEGRKNPITIIEFNPWWFSGKEDLTRQFFTAFGQGLSKRWKNAYALIKAVGAIAETVSPIGRSVGVVADSLREWRDPDRKTIHELKEIVNEKLIDLGRVLVIIDDIDRLTDPEIREIFQVIKAIGDFSNVIYLLAYDREVVLASLKGTQEGNPDEYLEKIVQTSFDLPIPMDWDLRQLFYHEFSQILPEAERAVLKSEREVKVMSRIVSFLDTPRKMKRFLNAYRLSYPVVLPEVNPVDFAGIELVRLLRPGFYHYIQRNEDQFVLPYPVSFSADDFEGIQRVLSEAIRQGENPSPFHKALRDLICLLFPVVNAAFDSEPQSRYLGLGAERIQLREKRICAKEKFPLYFRWSLPEGSISSGEFDSILALSGDAESFGYELRKLGAQKRGTGESRIIEFLNLLHANLDRVPNGNIEPVLLALAREGDAFLPVIEESGKYYSDSFVFIPVEQIFIELLGRVDPSDRIALLTTVIENGTALLLLSLIVQDIALRVEGRDPADPSRLMTAEQLDELNLVMARRIQNAAADGSLLNNIGLYHILRVWVTVSPDSIEQIQRWVTTSVADCQGVVKFIDGFYLPGVVASSANVSFYYRIGFDLMTRLIDPFLLADIARSMSDSSEISEHQREALNDFCLELDMSKRRGRPLVKETLSDAQSTSPIGENNGPSSSANPEPGD